MQGDRGAANHSRGGRGARGPDFTAELRHALEARLGSTGGAWESILNHGADAGPVYLTRWDAPTDTMVQEGAQVEDPVLAENEAGVQEWLTALQKMSAEIRRVLRPDTVDARGRKRRRAQVAAAVGPALPLSRAVVDADRSGAAVPV